MSKTHPLRIWRKAAGKTQAELGAIVGVRGSTISMIVNYTKMSAIL